MKVMSLVFSYQCFYLFDEANLINEIAISYISLQWTDIEKRMTFYPKLSCYHCKLTVTMTPLK